MQPAPPKISLVIPTYNRATLLLETLHSAFGQTVPFFEIIVADDASTDHTEAALRQFGERVTLLKLAKGGVQAARNAGAAHAHGDFIALCDSDDLLEPDFVETISTWLSARPDCDAVYANFRTFDETKIDSDKFAGAPANFFETATTSGLFLHDIADLYGRVIRYQLLFVSGCVFKKRFYKNLGGFDEQFNNVGGEDFEFTLRVLAGRVALCTQPLTRIRRHSGNDSRNTIRQNMGGAVILEHALTHHAHAAPYHNALRASITARRVDAFHAAYAIGEFDTALAVLALLTAPVRDRKLRLKAAIIRLPSFIRRIVWRATQARPAGVA